MNARSSRFVLMVGVLGLVAIACKPVARRDGGPDEDVAVVVPMDAPPLTDARPDTVTPPPMDVQGVDTPPPPPADVPMSNPCEPSRIVDLTAIAADAGVTDASATDGGDAGPRTGVRYTGTTNDMAILQGGGIHPSATCVPPQMSIARTAAYQLAFRYRMRATARLRISALNPGTDPALDTILILVNQCMVGATEMACNDDTTGGAVPRHSTISTASTITAGTEVFIILGGYSPPYYPDALERGRFELTVDEM
jgi:hypothetical protein